MIFIKQFVYKWTVESGQWTVKIQVVFYFQLSTINYQLKLNQRSSWWLLQGCPPLPIPNREVKPLSADDTWVIPGKVCRCRILERTSSCKRWGFFIFDSFLIQLKSFLFGRKNINIVVRKLM